MGAGRTATAGAGGVGAGPDRGREGQTFGGASLAARYASFVKLPHTLFALPFAGLGVVLASYTDRARLTAVTVVWVVIAFTAARFAAMAFNRIADRHYDALNPRTRQRELPAGRLTVTQAVAALVLACGLFVFAAFRLNELCGMLAPVALAWVFFYSYTKRFTAWAHLVLGIGLAIAPVGAYLAVTGAWSQPPSAMIVLAAGVACWVAGFDIIYSLQDVDFDRAHGLHSLAARHDTGGALALARLFHAASFAAFLALGALRLFPLGAPYFIGVAVMGGLLAYEHWVVRHAGRDDLDLRRIDRAFFHTNVAVSMTLFLGALVDRVLSLG